MLTEIKYQGSRDWIAVTLRESELHQRDGTLVLAPEATVNPVS